MSLIPGFEALYLLADIGATNARFHQADDAGLCGAIAVFPTAAFSSAADLFAAVNDHFGPGQYRCVVVAAAGPKEDDGSIRTTNTGLRLSAADGQQHFTAPTHVVNDFYALASGVPYFDNLVQIGGNSETPRGNKAILGPGTGLGMAGVVDLGDSWKVVPTEGGHMDLAPGNHLEAELWGTLSQLVDHVSWESALSGPGLVNLYTAMCALWGSKPEPLTPAEIVAQGTDMQSPVCHQTLETFAGLLGSAAGNLALMFLASGGIYLAGGIAQKMADFLIASPLRRRFEERGPMTGLVRQIPIFLVADEEPGLLGAYRLALGGAHQAG